MQVKLASQPALEDLHRMHMTDAIRVGLHGATRGQLTMQDSISGVNTKRQKFRFTTNIEPQTLKLTCMIKLAVLKIGVEIPDT